MRNTALHLNMGREVVYWGAERDMITSCVATGQAWGRGKMSEELLGTFRGRPAGSQSRPVKRGPQPEASLALCGSDPVGEA